MIDDLRNCFNSMPSFSNLRAPKLEGNLLLVVLYKLADLAKSIIKGVMNGNIVAVN